MKSIVLVDSDNGRKSLKFPKLMTSINIQGLTVLFRAPSIGTVLVVGHSGYTIGDSSHQWVMDMFVDLPIGQSVVLENDGGDQ
jgi:hypothetical protein